MLPGAATISHGRTKENASIDVDTTSVSKCMRNAPSRCARRTKCAAVHTMARYNSKTFVSAVRCVHVLQPTHSEASQLVAADVASRKGKCDGSRTAPNRWSGSLADGEM